MGEGMKLLLDTHALLWWLTDDPKLSVQAMKAIADEKNSIFVSAASAWEIATKQRIGKLEHLPGVVERFACGSRWLYSPSHYLCPFLACWFLHHATP
jgi:hypothetical protein